MIHRTAIALFTAAGLLVSGAVFADTADAPSALCGGDKKKDVKKPEDKKPANPASAERLCGDHEKKSDKKKDKKTKNPV